MDEKEFWDKYDATRTVRFETPQAEELDLWGFSGYCETSDIPVDCTICGDPMFFPLNRPAFCLNDHESFTEDDSDRWVQNLMLALGLAIGLVSVCMMVRDLLTR